MLTLSTIDLAAALAACDLRALAGHAAASAVASALENGAGAGAEREAAERLDDWTSLTDVTGCMAFIALPDADLRRVARLAVALLEGRA